MHDPEKNEFCFIKKMLFFQTFHWQNVWFGGTHGKCKITSIFFNAFVVSYLKMGTPLRRDWPRSPQDRDGGPPSISDNVIFNLILKINDYSNDVAIHTHVLQRHEIRHTFLFQSVFKTRPIRKYSTKQQVIFWKKNTYRILYCIMICGDF